MTIDDFRSSYGRACLLFYAWLVYGYDRGTTAV